MGVQRTYFWRAQDRVCIHVPQPWTDSYCLSARYTLNGVIVRHAVLRSFKTLPLSPCSGPRARARASAHPSDQLAGSASKAGRAAVDGLRLLLSQQTSHGRRDAGPKHGPQHHRRPWKPQREGGWRPGVARARRWCHPMVPLLVFPSCRGQSLRSETGRNGVNATASPRWHLPTLPCCCADTTLPAGGQRTH